MIFRAVPAAAVKVAIQFAKKAVIVVAPIIVDLAAGEVKNAITKGNKGEK